MTAAPLRLHISMAASAIEQGTSFGQFLLTSKDSFPNAGEHSRSIPQKKTLLHPKANHVTPKGFCHSLHKRFQDGMGRLVIAYVKRLFA